MKNADIGMVMRLLEKETGRFEPPSVTQISARRKPFEVLISCILSLRTRDAVTTKASLRLFSKANTPKGLLELGEKSIEKLIYPVGFYKTKAKAIKGVCRDIIMNGGKVPDTIDGLLKLKGVGRKTANIVVTLGFGKPGIAVDTHVHRVSNRLGYVNTRKPEETEFELRKKLPRKYWIGYNDLLVTWGQNVCLPISPFCSRCALIKYCNKTGVSKSR